MGGRLLKPASKKPGPADSRAQESAEPAPFSGAERPDHAPGWPRRLAVATGILALGGALLPSTLGLLGTRDLGLRLLGVLGLCAQTLGFAALVAWVRRPRHALHGTLLEVLERVHVLFPLALAGLALLGLGAAARELPTGAQVVLGLGISLTLGLLVGELPGRALPEEPHGLPVFALYAALRLVWVGPPALLLLPWVVLEGREGPLGSLVRSWRVAGRLGEARDPALGARFLGDIYLWFALLPVLAPGLLGVCILGSFGALLGNFHEALILPGWMLGCALGALLLGLCLDTTLRCWHFQETPTAPRRLDATTPGSGDPGAGGSLRLA